MDGPVGIAPPTSTWTLETAYQYATARAIPPADPDGEPLYNCPFPPCAKQFSKRFNLKAHLRVHTGDKPFACSYPGCSRRFMWKSSLTSHQAGHTRRKAELAKRNSAVSHHQHQHRIPQWRQPLQPQPVQHQSVPHQPPSQPSQQPQQQHYIQHQPQQQQQQQQHQQQQNPHQQQQQQQQHQQQQQQHQQLQQQHHHHHRQQQQQQQQQHQQPHPQPNHHQPQSQQQQLHQLPFSQPVSTSQLSYIPPHHSQPHPASQPLPTPQSTYPIHHRLPRIDQPHQQSHHLSPTVAEERHRQREQLLQEQQRELHRQQQRLKEQERILKQQQLQHEEEQRRIEQMKAHREQPMLDPAHSTAKPHPSAQSQPLPNPSLGLPQHQLPPTTLRPPASHPQRPPVPRTPNHQVQQLPSVSPRPLPHQQGPHHAQPQYDEQPISKPQPLPVDSKMEPSPTPKQEDLPQHTASRPPTSPVPPTSGRDLARLMKKDALAQTGKPSSALLTHPPSHGLSSTPSLLPSPSASLGMPPSPTAFSQQFLFPSQASSPTWATTPNVQTPSAPGRSPMAVSPKPPNTPSNQMDLQMSSGDHHAGDLSPLPAELPASPSVTSPVPPPILPEVSNNRTRRIPNRSARPPLGPSLSSGSAALLPPLANVAPAAPPTHIDLGGLGMEDEPSSSLPALGSPHTELSPLPVASPIFGTSQTPTSPMQPFSPFSGMNASSARTKPTTTW